MRNVYKPFIQTGGDFDGQYRPAVFDEAGIFRHVAFLATDQLWYSEEECQVICTALQLAYDAGIAYSARHLLDKATLDW